MSLQFFRDLNKNVNESLSILNEGIEITNGVHDVTNIHIPYLLQLSPSVAYTKGSEYNCCFFRLSNSPELICGSKDDDGERLSITGRSGGSISTPLRYLTVESPLNSPVETNIEEKDATEDSALHTDNVNLCPLDQRCLLKVVDPEQYKNAMDAIINFLIIVERGMEGRPFANRSLLDNQVLPVLCSLVSLWDIVDVFTNGTVRHLQLFSEKDSILTGILKILSSTLKLIDKIVLYPEFITSNSDIKVIDRRITPRLQSKACDNGKLDVAGINIEESNESTFYGNDTSINAALGKNNARIRGFTFFGKVSMVCLNEVQRDKLNHCLSLLQSVGEMTQYGRTFMKVFSISLASGSMELRELLLMSLKILERLYAHNDVAYHIYCSNDIIYTANNLDEFYKRWILSFQDICVDCKNSIGQELINKVDTTNNDSYCMCPYIYHTNISPNRKIIEAEIVSSKLDIKQLLTLVLNSGDMTLKTHITRFIMLLVHNSETFRHYFASNGCLETVLTILETSFTEQFAVIKENLSQISNEISKHQMTTLKKDLTFATSILSHTLDSMLILRHCLLHNDVGDIPIALFTEKVTSILSTYLPTWMFYYLHGPGTVSDRESSLFSHSLKILLDICCYMVIFVPGNEPYADINHIELQNYITSLLSVIKLGRPVNTDPVMLKCLLDTGILDIVMFSAHILVSHTRFGSIVPENILDSMMQFIATVVNAASCTLETRDVLINRLRTPIADMMPPFYRYTYQTMLMQDLQSLKTSITSTFIARLSQFRLEMFGEMAYIPVILHWFLCLNDGDISDVIKEPYRYSLWMMLVLSGLLKIDERARDILKYSQDVYKHMIDTYKQWTGNITTTSDWRPIRYIVEFSLSMTANESDKSTLAAYVGESFLYNCVDILSWSLNTDGMHEKARIHVDLYHKILCAIILLSSNENTSIEATFDVKPIMAAIAIVLLRFRGVQVAEFNFGLTELIDLRELLIECYTSSDQIAAQRLLMDIDNAYHVDTIILDYDTISGIFFDAAQRTTKVEALWSFGWYRSNLYKFSLSPVIYRICSLVKRLLHQHVMNMLMDDVKNNIHRSPATTSTVSNKSHEEIERLQILHRDQIEFAEERVNQLSSQVEVLSKSYYIAEEKAMNLQKELDNALEVNAQLNSLLEKTRQ
uniref:Uncharacterized protein n=1 Tax=Babesia bovis TaxID=5865 RepID=A7ASA9_BABBO|eukprot:XP_001610996.1 hypothetical protein [Babesia bovis T2Bo]